MARKVTISEMHELAQEQGGKCLSAEYKKACTKMLWECHKGHQWYAAPHNVRRGNWCPICAKESIKLTITEMQELAKERGGKCLSTDYENQVTKLLWQCREGHQWEATPSGIKNAGNWCPVCAKAKKLTIEDMQKLAHERGGKCLSTELKNSYTTLLWECSYGHQWKAKPTGIKNGGTWCPYCLRGGTWSPGISPNQLTLDNMQELAHERGGKCLSTEYENIRTKLLWECREGHQWEATPSSIKYGSWCPVCARKNKLTIEEMHALAHERGGKCLSTEYKNNSTKLLWECREGHQWWSVPKSIKTSKSWCPLCIKKKKNDKSES